MNRNDLTNLMNYKEYPSISIILPTHRTAPENRQDSIRLKNLIKDAERRLLEEFNPKEVRQIIDKVNSVTDDIDYNYLLDGLAIFVNKSFGGKYKLPFPVKEQLVIDETFATRNLIYTLNRSPKYWVLVLSEKPTRLYEGFRDQLLEVNNENFPVFFQETTWDEPLRVGEITNTSSFRNEKNKQFFRKIDRTLKTLNFEQLPIVVTGVERYLSFYDEVTEQKNLIIAKLDGSYDNTPPHQIARMIWPLVLEVIEKNKVELLNELEKAVSANKYSSGIQQCWRRASEGRIQTLLVEKDFHYPATMSDDKLTLYPAEAADLPGVTDDAVDELIETVIQKSGRVAFVDYESLKIHQRITAILRY